MMEYVCMCAIAEYAGDASQAQYIGGEWVEATLRDGIEMETKHTYLKVSSLAIPDGGGGGERNLTNT